MSDNSLSIESQLLAEQLQVKHKNVLENKATRAIVRWKFLPYKPIQNFSEKKYFNKAIKSIKGLGPYLKGVLDYNSLN